jgi:response regulator RpfG family c-di-GMP phosphodiesterase
MGSAIPMEARITCLVDVYDALMSRRVYKRPWQEEEVLAYLHNESGKLFDPHLVSSFFDHYPRFQAIQTRHPDRMVEPELPL